MLERKGGDLLKRVLVVVPGLSTGGGEKMAIDVASRIDPAACEVTVVSLYPRADKQLSRLADQMGLRVIYLSKKLGTDPRTVIELRRVIREIKPDVIHTHLYVVPYVLLAAPRRIRKFHTVHNVAQKEAAGLLRVFMRLAYRFGNFTPVAISPLCAQTLEEVYHIPSSAFPCILNGVDTDRFSPMPIPHPAFRFTTVGRMQPQKNHRLLIEAFASVHERHPDAELAIVGEGYLRPELEAYAASLGLTDAVHMDGESEHVPEELNASDVFVMSSDYEGLPVVVLEAMACGLPVVSTAAGGVVDLVSDGDNGFITPIGDAQALAKAMLAVREDGDLRARMARRSRECAEQYSIQSCAQRYQALYLEGFEAKK